MGTSYERELRSVLAGEIKGVRAVTRSCSEVERAKAMRVVKRPFLVVRAPGSGSEGTGDLLALRGDICFPIEVKTSKSERIYLSGRTMDQYNSLKSTGEKCGLLPLYAFRLKGVRGDSWRIMKVEVEGLTGKLRHLSRSIPALPLTSRGTRAVKGAGMRSQCVVLRRFESCPLHQKFNPEEYCSSLEVSLSKVRQRTGTPPSLGLAR